jgi:AraC-like DNA-binding protein
MFPLISVRLILDGGFDVDFGDQGTIRLDQTYLQGPNTTTFRYSLQKCRILGLGFYPAGFARFWDLDMNKVANGWAPLAETTGNALLDMTPAIAGLKTHEDRFAAVDRYLLGLLESTRSNHQTALVQQMHKLLNSPEIERIEQIAERLRVSESTVAQMCKKRFGFPPKTLLRRQRFLRMLEELHARPYSEWPDYIDPQYADQSHMIRDFKYFMGMSPGQYLALPRPVQQQSAVARSAAVGRALQGVE